MGIIAARAGAVAALWIAGCTNDPTDTANDTPAPGEPDASDGWSPIEPLLAGQLQAALENARAEQGLPGLAMAVAYRESKKLWVSATGYADVPNQTAWLASDESRIGSVTKTFTAALVLRLVEEGLVSLADPIETWVPGGYAGPTLEHLLGHTSGIVSYNYVGSFDESASWQPMELVDWAYAHEPVLRFTPGTQWEYSNTNFVLLGLVIEAATGLAYGDALQTWLFDEAGLIETRLALTGDESPRLVRSYAGTPPVDNTDSGDPSGGWAAGAIVSTPRELALWTVGLYGGNLLSPDTLGRMTTPNGVTGADEEDYGLGTIIENGADDDSEYTLQGHTGGIAGYATSAFYLKELDVGLIVMSNWKQTDLRAASGHGWAAVLAAESP
jgi:D-alanyl-D-alanine carboxypeptidase